MATTFSILRNKILQNIVEILKAPYILLVHPKRQSWDISLSILQELPESTLGGKLYKFLKSNNLNLQPKYESHDIYHVISGYGTGLQNEAKLFFFLLGNGKKSISVIGSICVALLFMPEHYISFYYAYKKGGSFKPIYNIDFKSKLEHNYSDFIKSICKYKSMS